MQIISRLVPFQGFAKKYETPTTERKMEANRRITHDVQFCFSLVSQSLFIKSVLILGKYLVPTLVVQRSFERRMVREVPVPTHFFVGNNVCTTDKWRLTYVLSLQSGSVFDIGVGYQ